jgi:hypothetical protein
MTGAAVLVSAVSLAASPAHVALTGAASQSIQVTNAGRTPVVVDVGLAGFALDLRGRPKIVPVHRGLRPLSWLRVVPPRITVPAGGSATLEARSRVPKGASPGEHDAVVLLTTVPRRGQAIAVRMRVGITVALQVPGKIVRRLELRGLAASRRGVLDLALANRGNVSELLERKRVDVVLQRAGHVLARLHPTVRELLPGTRGIAEILYPGRLHGWVRAVVELKARTADGPVMRRSFKLRL